MFNAYWHAPYPESARSRVRVPIPHRRVPHLCTCLGACHLADNLRTDAPPPRASPCLPPAPPHSPGSPLSDHQPSSHYRLPCAYLCVYRIVKAAATERCPPRRVRTARGTVRVGAIGAHLSVLGAVRYRWAVLVVVRRTLFRHFRFPAIPAVRGVLFILPPDSRSERMKRI